MSDSYDFIIVGGGTAGCVLASRLTEDSSAQILLLEAGRWDRHPLIHLPVGFAKLTSGPYTWGYETVPQKHANNRKIPYAQARVIGGGSSINAEIFTRGNPQDYDRWAQDEGCDGWSFDNIKKYFIRSEGNTSRSGEWHGTDGPLGVSDLKSPLPVTRAFVQACEEYGIPQNPDFNGPIQEGAGIYQTTTLNGRRCSAARGYLRPAMKQENLTVIAQTSARRIIFEGQRAVGVEFTLSGSLKSATAMREVIITSGAIGTPKLMMLSGLGPADHLRKCGIDVIQDMPGVGENLNDHYGVDIIGELKGAHSLDKYDQPHRAFWAGIQYVLFNSGPVTSNVVEGGAFWRNDPEQDIPDLQFHFLAGSGKEEGIPPVPSGLGVTLNSYTLRPKSRGTVRLRSADPDAPPLIDPNFLSDPYDLKTAAAGVRISTEIFRQHSLRKYIKRLYLPDEDGANSEADLKEFVRQYGRTSYHPSCTCAMGQGQTSVVDPKLRVHGMEGLRICDSSVMPSLIGSNTNAPTAMIAEKASDLIRGNH